jgi:hypothetical protein
MIRNFGWFDWMFVALFFTSNLYASDFQSPRTAGLGGAGHASPLLSDAIYLNPSFVSFMKTHSLSVNYLTYKGIQDAATTGYSGNNINFSILDGDPDSLFQAGAAYTRRSDSSFFHLGASKDFFERYGAGVGAKFIFPNNPSGTRLTDLTLSASGILGSWFQAAFIVDNLFESATSLGMYREYILGTKINFDSIILIYLDPHWAPSLVSSQTQWGYEAGAEFPFFSDFFLRIGTFKNAYIPFESQRGNGYGAGVGWLAPKLSLDYSLSRALQPIPALAHNFGVIVYF